MGDYVHLPASSRPYLAATDNKPGRWCGRCGTEPSPRALPYRGMDGEGREGEERGAGEGAEREGWGDESVKDRVM